MGRSGKSSSSNREICGSREGRRDKEYLDDKK